MPTISLKKIWNFPLNYVLYRCKFNRSLFQFNIVDLNNVLTEILLQFILYLGQLSLIRSRWWTSPLPPTWVRYPPAFCWQGSTCRITATCFFFWRRICSIRFRRTSQLSNRLQRRIWKLSSWKRLSNSSERFGRF